MTERAVLVIRRRRLLGESPKAEAAGSPRSSVLRGTSGAGRVLQSLAELGRTFPTVIQSIHDADTSVEDFDALDLGRRFACVILGSHLVNVPDEGLRRAFLVAARRHVASEGEILVEHHPVDWAATAAEVRATAGGSVGMVDVQRHPPFVSAVSVYDAGGRIARQPFTARVLSEAELGSALADAGLRVGGRLGPTWLAASPALD
jgi:hypothetical protein